MLIHRRFIVSCTIFNSSSFQLNDTIFVLFIYNVWIVLIHHIPAFDATRNCITYVDYKGIFFLYHFACICCRAGM